MQHLSPRNHGHQSYSSLHAGVLLIRLNRFTGSCRIERSVTTVIQNPPQILQRARRTLYNGLRQCRGGGINVEARRSLHLRIVKTISQIEAPTCPGATAGRHHLQDGVRIRLQQSRGDFDVFANVGRLLVVQSVLRVFLCVIKQYFDRAKRISWFRTYHWGPRSGAKQEVWKGQSHVTSRDVVCTNKGRVVESRRYPSYIDKGADDLVHPGRFEGIVGKDWRDEHGGTIAWAVTLVVSLYESGGHVVWNKRLCQWARI